MLLEKGYDVESAGFLRKWKNKDRPLIVCVLADVTYLLKGLQKKLQKDTCVLSDFSNLKAKNIGQLEELQNEPLTVAGKKHALVNLVIIMCSLVLNFNNQLDKLAHTTCMSQIAVHLLLFVLKLFQA